MAKELGVKVKVKTVVKAYEKAFPMLSLEMRIGKRATERATSWYYSSPGPECLKWDENPSCVFNPFAATVTLRGANVES